MMYTWVAREILWRLSSEFQAPGPISFPVDAKELQPIEVRWPTKYEWVHTHVWVDDLASGLRRYVSVKTAEIPQAGPGGIVIFQIVCDGIPFDIAIDTSDYMDRIEMQSLKRSHLYFKMQFRNQGYNNIPEGANKIIPGGYVNGRPEIYHYLPYLRKLASRGKAGYDVYGRFGLEFAREIRHKAVELLRGQNRFRYSGGLNKVRYSQSLVEAAQAKICIDLPGNGDFCFRLVDYFAVGACVIGPRHRTRMHVDLEDRKHLVYAKDDLSDLIPLCDYYLEHSAEREQIGHNARTYFDSYLHRQQLAAYYLYHCLTRLPNMRISKGHTQCQTQ